MCYDDALYKFTFYLLTYSLIKTDVAKYSVTFFSLHKHAFTAAQTHSDLHIL